MNVVIVESPAKAKSIGRYLGPDFEVLATYGHLRDLRVKPGSVVPEEGFRMVWEVDEDSAKRIRAIAKSLKGSGRLVLATDPDREGEAISWHLVEELRERKALHDGLTVERISFNAITKAAVTDAIKHPRDIDQELVDAYLARRALDYLVGFNLSPVLLRKLPGARSAGRVQSVAVRLAVEREQEIEAFTAREHWKVHAFLHAPDGTVFPARLTLLDGRKIGQFGLPDETSAREAERILLEATGFTVAEIVAKPLRRSPPAPFITSSLQQEASRKLGSPPARTMSTAQRLYESGLITYMRTDGVDMAPEAVQATRSMIETRFGRDYLPDQPRTYRSRVKNAQEAHECIRPTDPAHLPAKAEDLPPDQAALYRLVWERTMASQMPDARFERTTAEIDVTGATETRVRASGQVLRFDGFLKIYRDQEKTEKEEAEADPEEDQLRQLPALADNDPLKRDRIEATQHFTKPPPRYTQASLVRKLEELGIGRPSTYATILSVIQDRGYVESDGNRVAPTFLGRLVTAFLESHFGRYVAYEFTADLESKLDDISGGRAARNDVLGEFWDNFSPAVGEAAELRIREVLDRVEKELESILFPPRSDGVDPHLCPKCHTGNLGLRASRKANVFLGCQRYPDCNFVRSLDSADSEMADWLGDRELGTDPEKRPVTVRKGPYGFYFQLGDRPGSEPQDKPPRASLPEGVDPMTVSLETALLYLALPRPIGPHPEDGQEIVAGIGRYGPYVKHERTYANIPKEENVLEIGLNRAVDLIAAKRDRGGKRGGSSASALKELGEHPEGGEVRVLDGRYGPYVKWKSLNASLPSGMEPEDVTMDAAVELLNKRKARKKSKR